MGGRRARNLIRALTGAALCMALTACLGAPVPEDLPAVAAGQPSLYRLEVALLVFYGDLLLITPAFSGLIRGRLPIEISTRGARFGEEADQSNQWSEKKIEDLEGVAENLSEGLRNVQLKLEQLREAAARDKTPPTVGSEK
jgi:hypothetical protein